MKIILKTLVIATILFNSCQSNKKETALKTGKISRPNIIYILADDLGYGDISCYGQTKFKTPNIDKLAEDGMLFTQHYSGSTVCAPSRSSLMTGQHTGHTFIRGNREVLPEGQYPISSSEVTIAELLKETGYVTGAFGKWGLGYPGSEGDPNNQGFDEFYGYNCQRIGHNYYPYHMWHNQTKEILEGNEGAGTEMYGPEIIHKKAMTFLEKNKDTTFFMYYPSIIPHAELLIPKRYMKNFQGKYPPETKFEGSDANDVKYYKNGGYGSQEEPHATFAAMISLLDMQVGEIRAKVEELGIAENTLIIFTSDNGPHLEGGADPEYFNSNGIYRGFKRDLYEGGIRVPMIAYWPTKIKANTTSNHVSAFWDVLPTITDLAGLETPKNTDGISFMPTLLETEEQVKHDFLYWEFHTIYGVPAQAVLIGQQWKAIRFFKKGDYTPFEIYNLETDPEEQNNIANENPEYMKRALEIINRERRNSPIKIWNFNKDKLN